MTLEDEIKLLLEAPTMNARDMRTMLRQDHDEVLQARPRHVRIGERRRTPGAVPAAEAGARRALARRGEGSLRRLLKSTIRTCSDLAYEGYVEHGVLDDLLEKLLKAGRPRRTSGRRTPRCCFEFLERHIEEEHERMFAELEEHFSDDERETMGRRFTARQGADGDEAEGGVRTQPDPPVGAAGGRHAWHKSLSASSTISKRAQAASTSCSR